MLFNNKLFNSIACLLSFTNLQLVIPGRTWILLYLGRTVYKRLWACLALYLSCSRQDVQLHQNLVVLMSSWKQTQEITGLENSNNLPSKQYFFILKISTVGRTENAMFRISSLYTAYLSLQNVCNSVFVINTN